jgi:hypothetical protein
MSSSISKSSKPTPQLFDVIVGNPPYVTLSLGKNQEKSNQKLLNYYKEKYPNSMEYKGNLYAIFIERGINLLNFGGYLSFIVPNTLLLSLSFSKIRRFILENCEIKSILNLKYEVFEDANTGGTCIFVIKKVENPNQKNTLKYSEIESEEQFKEKKFIEICQEEFYKDEFYRFSGLQDTIVKKIKGETLPLGEITKFYQGIITGDNKKFLTQEKTDDKHKKILRGKDIDKYSISYDNWYVYYEPKELWSNTDETFFKSEEKLINRQTGDGLVASYDNNKYFSLDSTHVQILINDNFNLKYILACFNSEILNQIYKEKVQEQGKVFSQVKTVVLKTLPIPKATAEQQARITELVDQIMGLKKQAREQTQKFLRTIQREYQPKTISKKLNEFYKLDFGDFVKELEKQKVKLTLAKKEELEEYFEGKKVNILDMEGKIVEVDERIEGLVWGFYGVE